MEFDAYVARNRLTGGYMAENKVLRDLKKHVMAKAEPGKNVAIFSRTNLGGEREVCRITVPMPKVARPTVHTIEKTEKLASVKEPKPEPTPFKPIVVDKWTIANVTTLKGFPINPPKPHPKTGKPMSYMRFSVPIITVSVRQNHWPVDAFIGITRSKGGFSLKFPDGDRSETMGPSLTTVKLAERFGKITTDTIFMCIANALND